MREGITGYRRLFWSYLQVPIKDIKKIFQNYHYKTKILAASIRGQEHIIECAKIGADVVTASFTLLSSLIKHPLTDSGLKKFIEDYKNTC